MSCFHPLSAIPYPAGHQKAGQFCILPHSSAAGAIDWRSYGIGVDGVDLSTGELLQMIKLPCGKCAGCRMDQAKAWATRITCESLEYPPEANWFVTLTYANPSDMADLPRYGLDKLFTADNAMTLVPEHCTAFLKRLRDNHNRKVGRDYDPPMYFDAISNRERPLGIRYFLAGEYGDRTLRPHYHLCMMNMPLDDLRQIGKNELGMPLYNSDLLTDAWGFGHVVVAPMSHATTAYCARYCMKKANGRDPLFYEDLKIKPEYTVMSRRPGIGYNYIRENALDIYEHDQIVLPASSKDKPHKVTPPRYFDLHAKEIDPLMVARAKSKRAERAEIMRNLKLSATDLDEAAFLLVEEGRFLDRTKKLYRGL